MSKHTRPTPRVGIERNAGEGNSRRFVSRAHNGPLRETTTQTAARQHATELSDQHLVAH